MAIEEVEVVIRRKLKKVVERLQEAVDDKSLTTRHLVLAAKYSKTDLIELIQDYQ